jgi:segregation and condensation protein A
VNVVPITSTSAPASAPVAKLYGEPYIELPHDLYIPPDALEIILEAFEGPLDLLLYLIRKENLDILDIPMAPLTRQYLEYVDIMRSKNLELAAEYLVMAAMLMEIKSRLLLPRPPAAAAAEEDPRAELVRRLLEYEQMKKAAQALDELPQVGRNVVAISVWIEKRLSERLPDVHPQDLAEAWRGLLHRARARAPHRDHAVRMLCAHLRKIEPCRTQLTPSASWRRRCSPRRNPFPSPS